jgi:hypothetical protein
MRNAEDCSLIGEVMIILILGYRWRQQKADNRYNHHADEDEYAIVAKPARHHLTTIAKVTVKVRARCTKAPNTIA